MNNRRFDQRSNQRFCVTKTYWDTVKGVDGKDELEFHQECIAEDVSGDEAARISLEVENREPECVCITTQM